MLKEFPLPAKVNFRSLQKLISISLHTTFVLTDNNILRVILYTEQLNDWQSLRPDPLR